MKWLWTTAGLCLLALCSAGPVTEPTKDKFGIPKPDSLSITLVQRSNQITQYDISFQSLMATPKDIENCHLLKLTYDDINGTPEDSKYSTDVNYADPDYTATFEDNFDDNKGHKVEFALDCYKTTDTLPLIIGNAEWDQFPSFPTKFEGQLGKTTDNIFILRYTLEGDGSMTILQPTPLGTCVVNTAITYYINSNATHIFKPCSTQVTSDASVPVCDQEVNITPEISLAELKITSILLNYDDGNPEIVMNVSPTSKSDDQTMDVIVTHGGKTSLTLSKKLNNAKIPVTELTVPSEESIKIDIILLDAGTMISYKGDIIIKDINLVGYAVSGTSFEVRWNKVDDVNSYLITRTAATGDDPSFKSADVTCEALEVHCFGYFTELPSFSYQVTVPVTVDGKKKIQSNSITVSGTGSSSPDLNIQHVKLQGYGNELKATVCFNHTNNNADEAFSHYDVVLIDHKGQFQKSKLITMKAAEDDHFCSKPFSVKDQDFKVTEEAKIIVIKRAQDGLSVLASGEAPLL